MNTGGMEQITGDSRIKQVVCHQQQKRLMQRLILKSRCPYPASVH